MVKNQHAAPHSKGGQQVKGEGNSRATVRTSPKKRSCQNCPRDFSKTNVPNRLPIALIGNSGTKIHTGGTTSCQEVNSPRGYALSHTPFNSK